jgi:hypothetical protein
VVIFRVLFSLFIIGAAIYWYFNPDSHMEPIIIIMSSILVLIASFNHWFISKKSDGKPVEESELTINIISPKVRCYREWIDYGIKIDFELFFNKKVLIKSIKLKYKEPLGFGEKWEQRAKLYYVELDNEDLLKQDLAQLEKSLKAKVSLPSFPCIFEEKSILQVTLCGYVAGERLSDGWEGISLNNWTLVVEYNENQTLETPIILQAHDNSEKRATEFKYVGFVNA